jgi:hypothetical protein
MGTEEEKDNAEKVAEETKKTKEFMEHMLGLKDQSIKKSQEEIRLIEEQLNTLKELNVTRGTTLGDLENQRKHQEAIIQKIKEREKLNEHLIALGMDRKEVEKSTLEQLERSTVAYSHANDETIKLLEGAKEREKSEQKIGKYAKDFFNIKAKTDDMMSGLAKKSAIFSTNLGKMAEGYRGLLGNKAAQAAMVASFTQQFNLQNLIVGTAENIILATTKLVISADKATTSLAAATGTGRKFNDVLIGAQRTGNLFGLSMDEAGKAIQALNAGTTNFTQVGKATQTSLTTNVALLSKLGVSADQSAKMINTLNLSLGMNMEESMEATKSIALMGTELGITAAQMTKDFDKAMGTLAVYGDKAPGIFKNIAASAKAAGVEMSSLLNIAKKFDTFKDAAETVGMMNALLGTQLSTTEMLMKTEDERIETLIGTVQAQGRAFADMGRFEQKAIASAAGITDMNEAAKIFGMNLSQFKDYQNQMDENADTQEKFKDAIDASIPIATKLMAIFTELGVFVMPILEGIHMALDLIKWVLNEMNPAFKTFLKIATMIGAGVVIFLKLKAVFLSIAGVLAPIGTFIAGVAGAVNPIVWAIMGVVLAVGALWAMFRSGDKEVDNLTNKLNKLDDVNVKASANVNTVRRDNTTRVQSQGQSMRQNQTQSAVNSNTIVQQGGLQPGQPVIISLDQDGMSQITAKIKNDGREAAADLMWGKT